MEHTLIFTIENNFSGKSFCNNCGGELKLYDLNIKFGNIFSTKMYCAEQSTLENKFLKDLKAVNSVKILKGKLMLCKDM